MTVETARFRHRPFRFRRDDVDASMPGDRWYFAYGSNLSIDQKERRSRRIRRAIPCRLSGYRFAFNKRSNKGEIYANIVPDPSAEVWGVVYLCNPAAIRELDGWEGVAGGHYEHVPVHVQSESGETIEAISYTAGDAFVCEPGKPSSDYLHRIVSGARHHGLPEEHIKQIESLAR
jgi:gamma-glutamylcyclotransferase